MYVVRTESALQQVSCNTFKMCTYLLIVLTSRLVPFKIV